MTICRRKICSKKVYAKQLCLHHYKLVKHKLCKERGCSKYRKKRYKYCTKHINKNKKKKIKTVTKTVIKNVKGECCICYEPYSKKQKATSTCGHVFCIDCIRKCSNCPLCRQNITVIPLIEN